MMTVKDIELVEEGLEGLRITNYKGGNLHVLEAQLAMAKLKYFLRTVEEAKKVLNGN